MGNNPTEALIKELFEKADVNKYGNINFDNLLNLMSEIPNEKTPEEEIIEAFAVLDKDGSGLIAEYDFRFVLTNFGEKLSEDEIDEMVK